MNGLGHGAAVIETPRVLGREIVKAVCRLRAERSHRIDTGLVRGLPIMIHEREGAGVDRRVTWPC